MADDAEHMQHIEVLRLGFKKLAIQALGLHVEPLFLRIERQIPQCRHSMSPEAHHAKAGAETPATGAATILSASQHFDSGLRQQSERIMIFWTRRPRGGHCASPGRQPDRPEISRAMDSGLG